MKRIALILSSVCAGTILGGCGVVTVGAQPGERTASPFPDVNLSTRPCAIQTVGLLNLTELPPRLTPAGLPSSQVGPRSLLDEATDGSIGNASASFQAVGFASPNAAPPTQVSQLAEAVTDYGTVTSAERWMAGQKRSNQPNDIPMYGNGVERTPPVPAIGDDTLLYQVDVGAPYNSTPFSGPFIGHVYTDIQVREGDLIYALSIDSGPDANPAALAISLVRRLMTKETAVCG